MAALLCMASSASAAGPLGKAAAGVEGAAKSVMGSQHPWDPHSPSFSSLLPEQVRPYPSFEGWYTRIVDVPKQFSAGVIMATNYATEESQVTLLLSLPDTNATKAVALKTKDAKFSSLPPDESPGDGSTEGDDIRGFIWEAQDLGKIVMKPHESRLEVNLEGYELKVRMDQKLPWNKDKTKKGPEGWVGSVPLFPCHWFVYSLSSRAEYTLVDSNKKNISGVAYAHQEKNWGETFPKGHVWVQGLAPDRSSQLVCSGAYFQMGKVSTPFVFALGYRSQAHELDLRTNDVGIIFKDADFAPLEGRFSLTGVGPSHTLKILVKTPPSSFSEPVLAPMGKVEWKPACRESFVATIETELYEHAVWGVASEDKLVEKLTFHCGALEFGEDLMQAALEHKEESS